MNPALPAPGVLRRDRGSPGRGPVRAPARAPRVARPVPRWWAVASGALFWLVNALVVSWWLTGGGWGTLTSFGGALVSIGRLTGLLGSSLLLCQVFLMARVPWVEQAWGQDRLARIHRLVGLTSFWLVIGHVVIITLGYHATGVAGLWTTIVDLVLHYPGMLLALAGTIALCLVVATSIRAARARLRYESWHLLHLYAYLGAGLALPHQLWTGQEFLTSTATTIFWWTLYAGCLAAVIVFRIALPAWRSRRLGLRVIGVRGELPGVSTVTIAGPGLATLPVQAGQFFQWRFRDGPGWTRAHPYSISAAPDGRTLRVTVAHVGDGTSRLGRLAVGTRVLIEGPYGRLHPGVRTRRKVLLMGSGIGIAPLRALLEGIDQAPGEVTVVYRVRARAQAVLVGELRQIADARGARLVVVEGPRAPGRSSWLPAQAAHLRDVDALREIVPDIAEHDVFLCGSGGWMDAARQAALDGGVPPAHVHLERFDY